MNTAGESFINILLCERPLRIPAGDTLFTVRERICPGADVTVYNGAPAETDRALHEGDAVVFIRRGEIPDPADLEALMAARHTPGVHAVLRRSCVGIAGLGGLGSAVAVALTRIGIGRLVLADFDVVEPSNLNRQQYFMDQIGLLKADALRENLVRIHPCIEVERCALRVRPENIAILFGTVDVLVEAFDRAEEKAMLIEHALRLLPATPIVAASGLAGHYASNAIRTRRIGTRLYLCGDGQSAAVPGTGLMAPRVGIAAHHQANAVLRLLLGEDPAAQ